MLFEKNLGEARAHERKRFLRQHQPLEDQTYDHHHHHGQAAHHRYHL